MRGADRNPQRGPVKYRLKVICSKHDDHEVHRQMRGEAGGEICTPVELSAADGRSWIPRVCSSAIKAFFDYLIIVP